MPKLPEQATTRNRSRLFERTGGLSMTGQVPPSPPLPPVKTAFEAFAPSEISEPNPRTINSCEGIVGSNHVNGLHIFGVPVSRQLDYFEVNTFVRMYTSERIMNRELQLALFSVDTTHHATGQILLHRSLLPLTLLSWHLISTPNTLGVFRRRLQQFRSPMKLANWGERGKSRNKKP